MLSPRPQPPSRFFSSGLIIALAVVASLSGVLFGCAPPRVAMHRRVVSPQATPRSYDASSINAALPLLSDHFALSDSMEGIVVSVLLLGAVAGSLLAGLPADHLGRRWTIIISGVLFIVGNVLSSFLARTVGLLILGRIIIGAAIGVTSSVTPLYIAEMAPPQHRGGLVMFYQLSITIGILFALAIGKGLTPSENWRLMIFLAVARFLAMDIARARVRRDSDLRYPFRCHRCPRGCRSLAWRSSQSRRATCCEQASATPRAPCWCAFAAAKPWRTRSWRRSRPSRRRRGA
jgi:hypothetical protein